MRKTRLHLAHQKQRTRHVGCRNHPPREDALHPAPPGQDVAIDFRGMRKDVRPVGIEVLRNPVVTGDDDIRHVIAIAGHQKVGQHGLIGRCGGMGKVDTVLHHIDAGCRIENPVYTSCELSCPVPVMPARFEHEHALLSRSQHWPRKRRVDEQEQDDAEQEHTTPGRMKGYNEI